MELAVCRAHFVAIHPHTSPVQPNLPAKASSPSLVWTPSLAGTKASLPREEPFLCSGLTNVDAGLTGLVRDRIGSRQGGSASIQLTQRAAIGCKAVWGSQGRGRISDSEVSQPLAEWATGFNCPPVAGVKSLTEDFEGQGEALAVPVPPCIPIPSNFVELGQNGVSQGAKPGCQATASPNGALALPEVAPVTAEEVKCLQQDLQDRVKLEDRVAASLPADKHQKNSVHAARSGVGSHEGVTGEKLNNSAEAAMERDVQARQPSRKSASRSQLWNRVIFGTLIGLGAGWAVVAGDWWFAGSLAAIVALGTWEYFGLMDAKALKRMEPPSPPLAAKACCAMCFAMPLMTMYYGGRIGWAVVSAVGMLAAASLVQPSRPTHNQLSNLLFGLFYCGYLPSFWIRLRCGLPPSLPAPTLATALAQAWPAALGGPSQWTVGLVATFVAFATIIAADTGAYLGGKSFGRTKLIDISPKKTREGAAAGLASAVLVAVGLSKLFRWPSSLFSAATMGVLVFIASLFGDLSESVLKRDAGVKDSGRLIPGHGGILDRVDSYIFTGALVYSFVRIGLPLFGV